MALILNIETATDACSVALAKDGKLLAIAENEEPKSHAGVLTGLIQTVIDNSKLRLSQIDAIAISKGPGSFTGLRIGAATAKGLCYALNKPLIAINTLLSMTNHFISDHFKHRMENADADPAIENAEFLFVPMIDARRMEVYTADI